MCISWNYEGNFIIGNMCVSVSQGAQCTDRQQLTSSTAAHTEPRRLRYEEFPRKLLFYREDNVSTVAASNVKKIWISPLKIKNVKREWCVKVFSNFVLESVQSNSCIRDMGLTTF